MGHTHAILTTHLIFSTKERRPFLDAVARPRIHGYLGGIVRELGGRAITVNGTEDHVHLLVDLPPKVAVSDAVRVIKTNSSRWIHREITGFGDFGWQTGFGAFSVSKSRVADVETYIANQELHHASVSFQDEYRSFLAHHGLEIDEDLGCD